MSEVITQTLYFMASYIGIFVAIFGGMNWLTKGFIWKYLRVKASRGRKILSIVHSKTDTYYGIGHFEDDVYKFKRRDRKKAVVTNVTQGSVYMLSGVFVLEHSEDGKQIFQRNKAVYPGNDGRVVDNYLNRIIKAPQIEDSWRKFVLIGLAVIFIAVLIGLYFNYTIYDQMKLLQAAGVIQ